MAARGGGAAAAAAAGCRFGPFSIPEEHIFLRTEWSVAFVNLKPLVPGHVLVAPRRDPVPEAADGEAEALPQRLHALAADEVRDLFTVATRVGHALEGHYAADALTVSVQDGEDAGQTVPHVHVHVLPRRKGDFARNDEVYEQMDRLDLGEKFDLDVERRPRTHEEMAQEAAEYRGLFEQQDRDG